MSWRELRGHDKRGLDLIQHQLLEMLDADRHTFDLAAAALLAGADSQTLAEAIATSDRDVDHLEQLIRRELVVHAGVHGVRTNIPAMFVAMSIVKDIERVGDYAAELLTLARWGADLSHDEDRELLACDRDQISALIQEVRQALATRDPAQAEVLLSEAATMVDCLDARLATLVGGASRDQAVAVALFLHYARRIVGHLGNVLTSLVVPVDQLDFYDGTGRTARVTQVHRP
jgi:phosphate uptake regulator